MDLVTLAVICGAVFAVGIVLAIVGALVADVSDMWSTGETVGAVFAVAGVIMLVGGGAGAAVVLFVAVIDALTS